MIASNRELYLHLCIRHTLFIPSYVNVGTMRGTLSNANSFINPFWHLRFDLAKNPQTFVQLGTYFCLPICLSLVAQAIEYFLYFYPMNQKLNWLFCLDGLLVRVVASYARGPGFKPSRQHVLYNIFQLYRK